MVHIRLVYACSSWSQRVQLCRTWQCAGLVSSTVCSICCHSLVQNMLSCFGVTTPLLITICVALDYACRHYVLGKQCTALFFHVGMHDCLCHIYKFCLSESTAQQWQTCLGCSFQLLQNIFTACICIPHS